MCLDRDTVGIDQRAAPECFLDLLLDLGRLWFEPRLEAIKLLTPFTPLIQRTVRSA